VTDKELLADEKHVRLEALRCIEVMAREAARDYFAEHARPALVGKDVRFLLDSRTPEVWVDLFWRGFVPVGFRWLLGAMP
jgi:hypothetical protein